MVVLFSEVSGRVESAERTTAALARPISNSRIFKAFGTSAFMVERTSASRTSCSRRWVETRAIGEMENERVRGVRSEE